MELDKAFTFMFEDEKWQNKLFLALVISIVPILNFAWFGYLLHVMRNVLQNDEKPLPEWDKLGDYFMHGLLFVLGWFIYSIPIFLLLMFGGFSWLLLIPVNGTDIQNVVIGGLSITSMALLCILAIYGLILTIIYPAISIHYGKDFKFKSLFEISKIIEIVKVNPGHYFLAWLIVFAIGFVFVFVASWMGIFFNFIPCIGTIIAYLIIFGGSVWIGLIDYHIFAQVGKEAEELTELKGEVA